MLQSRRLPRLVSLLVVCSLILAPASCLAANASAASEPSPTNAGQAEQIVSIARQVMEQNDLNAVIISVRIGNRDVVTTALDKSMTGVQATTRMHLRNGAVAISYLSTVLLKLVDRKVVSLDDKLSRWLPELPNADKITLGMLAASRSGYSDYVQNPDFLKANNADPFRAWNRDELRQYGISKPLQYTPGTSWNYAHTNFLILGEALEKITGKPIDRLVADEVLRPLGLRNTQSSCTAEIPEPVLHAFTSDRGIYEDSTYWDPSWTLGCGLVETTNISDLITSAVGIGTGSLLSRTSHQLQIEPKSRITPANGPAVYYGLGIFTANSWLFQNPLFSGYQAIMAYQPSRQIAIAVATTVGPKGSADTNYSTQIFQKVGAYLDPKQPPTL